MCLNFKLNCFLGLWFCLILNFWFIKYPLSKQTEKIYDSFFKKNVFPNGTKLDLGNNKPNKKEEISKNDTYDEEEVIKKNSKYVIKNNYFVKYSNT